jgi:tetratricopeptide (TPR) repeat protein
MDVRGKIDQFCQKLERMVREISSNELGLSLGASDGNTSILMTVYRTALERYANDGDCLEVLERIFSAAESRPLQEVFAASKENDIQVLGHFAETFYGEGKMQIAAQLFQFLTLLSPNNVPYPYTYLHLAESLSELSIDSGLQIYDFILNIFPDNPAILLAAAKRYSEGERPKRALRILDHAKAVCEHNIKTDPTLQEFLDLLTPELEKLQNELAAKK